MDRTRGWCRSAAEAGAAFGLNESLLRSPWVVRALQQRTHVQIPGVRAFGAGPGDGQDGEKAPGIRSALCVPMLMAG
jgi:hypothetical protein